jgi:hypothetical protein
MRYLGVACAVGFTLCGSWARSQTCTTFAAQTSPVPLTTGQIAVEDVQNNFLYVYDIGSQTPLQVPTQSSNLTNPQNPVFTPDGSAILFDAVSTVNGTAETDLFYWQTSGQQQPTNLTSSMGNHRDQDVKFSPDGTQIVWKRDSGIAIASFSPNNGNPMLSNVQQLVSSPPEDSAPVFSPDLNYIYYFINNDGTEGPEQIWRYDFAAPTGANTSQAFPQDASLNYYYPTYGSQGVFLYTGWLPASSATCSVTTSPLKCYDKIFARAKLPAPGTAWNATDCKADNSDPAYVSPDYFIFSRDNPNNDGSQHNSQYDLYLGQISTGDAWLLLKPSDLNITAELSSLIGSNYTSIPATSKLGGKQAR